MLYHYIKIAFRNLWKYRGQTLISIAGLAVGFVCFALATLWIRFEKSYDDFHHDAERIFIVRNKGKSASWDGSKIRSLSPAPLAAYLKETYPEVADACHISAGPMSLTVDGVKHEVRHFRVDSTAMNFFRIRVIAGSMEFLNPFGEQIALTAAQARIFFGDEDPLGKTVKDGKIEVTVCAVVEGWPDHSNFSFGLVRGDNSSPQWNIYAGYTLVRLKANADAGAFAEKLGRMKIEKDSVIYTDLFITPITALRYDHPISATGMPYRYIFIFALIGALVVICSLFNTLTLHVARFHIREREFALRTVCGATAKSIFALLCTEFLAMLFLSFLPALALMRPVLPYFRELSGVSLPFSSIYAEACLYAAGITVLSLAVFGLLLAWFRRRTLQASFRKDGGSVSRKVSVVLQLIVGMGFIFCTTVVMKQIYSLYHIDLGFDFKNTATLNIYPLPDGKMIERKLQQIPEITAAIYGHNPLIPARSQVTMGARDLEAPPPETENEKAFFELTDISRKKIDFYSLRLLEGEMPGEHPEPEKVWINRSAAIQLGWQAATGKKITLGNDRAFTVAGVIHDVYNLSPTIPPKSMVMSGDMNKVFSYPGFDLSSKDFLIRYREGSRNICSEKIKSLVRAEYPDASLQIAYADEEYAGYMKSEMALLKLLLFVSLISVIIALTGLFSMVSLSCEKRRREFAIRKIHGATVRDILGMFVREYSLLLAISAVIAFPAGYFIMRRWLEHYVLRTAISAWIYVSILLLLAAVIVLCVGWRVYKASVENPVESINN
jgi:hypothetical protein